MNEHELQGMLMTLLESLIEAREEVDDGDEGGALVDIAREMVDEADGLEQVESFADAELLTTNAGLIIRCRDGSEFQLTVVQSR
ncbi:MAG: hypothetical protein IT480_19065 [Gammaproteobacteria bacterium]|nr:hypothetical protein [Gammaproteobacteria bacterium]